VSAVYTIYDEGFEEDAAVARSTGKFVDHTGRKTPDCRCSDTA
jgi:hypothetical protein